MMGKVKYIEAGQIVNTHGVRGEVRIVSWLDSPELLRSIRKFYIDENPVRVRASRVYKNGVIASLEGFDDLNAAMALKSKSVWIDRDDVALPEGGFFYADIFGTRVVTEGGEELGTLTDVIELPANHVYVVKGKREYLIPAVPAFILNTDVDGGVITVRMIEGL